MKTVRSKIVLGLLFTALLTGCKNNNANTEVTGNEYDGQTTMPVQADTTGRAIDSTSTNNGAGSRTGTGGTTGSGTTGTRGTTGTGGTANDTLGSGSQGR